MSVPEDRWYSQDHEWVLVRGQGPHGEGPREESIVRIGITDYAQRQLGDIVFIEFPAISGSVERGDAVGTVESTKSVSEVFAPVAGEVVARNAELDDSPELVNSDPYGEGWMIEIKLTDALVKGSLLDAEGYRALIEEQT